MGIFSIDDPITLDYLINKGFKRYTEPNSKTVIYRLEFKIKGYYKIYFINYYYKANKRSKQNLCVFTCQDPNSYRWSHKYTKTIHNKGVSKVIRKESKSIQTEWDMNLFIDECMSIVADFNGITKSEFVIIK